MSPGKETVYLVTHELFPRMVKTLFLRFYHSLGILVLSDDTKRVEITCATAEFNKLFTQHVLHSSGVMPCLQSPPLHSTPRVLPCSYGFYECKMKFLVKLAFYGFHIGMSPRPHPTDAELRYFDNNARCILLDSTFLQTPPALCSNSGPLALAVALPPINFQVQSLPLSS